MTALHKEYTAKIESQRQNYERQIRDIENSVVDWDELGAPVATRLKETQSFFEHICQVESKGYVNVDARWRFKAQFSCPTFSSIVGYAVEFKTRREAVEQAVNEFVRHCIRAKRMKRDLLESYLKQSTLLDKRKESKKNKKSEL